MKTRSGFPLRVRLSFGASFRLVLAIAAFGAIAYQTSRQTAIEAAVGRARAAAFSMSGRTSAAIATFLAPPAEVARHPALVAALRTGDSSAAAAEVLGTLPRDSLQTVSLALRTPDGRTVLSLHNPLPVWAFDESQREDSAHFGRLVVRGDSILYEAVVPVFDRGRAVGSIVRVRRVAATAGAVQVLNDVLGPGGELLFANRDGSQWTDVSQPIDPPARSGDDRYRRDGRSYLSGTYPIRGTPFVFVVGFSESRVLEPVRALVWKFTIIGAGIIAVALMLSWLSYTRITRPLTELAAATDSITARYAAVTPEPPGGDELARLQRAFETMEATIRTTHASLEDRIREASEALALLRAERSRLEQALDRVERSEEALRTADRRKDEFLATLAHELRNPLAPIRNAVQILKIKGAGNAELRWGHDVIDRQVGQMSRLLEDLLDVSRISHARLELRRERVDLAAIIRHAVETSRPLIDAGGHQLTVTLPAESLVLDGDPVRLAQVFANLLNNAAKYTERGGHIRVAAGREGDDAVVTVEDDGVGIEPGKLPGIFERFSQVHPVREPGHPGLGSGLGIGLSLVRGLVELHGGRVDGASAGPGQGSCFTVRLPLALAAMAAGSAPVTDQAAPAAPSRRLLIADDLEDSTDSLAEWLRLRGHEVFTAYDGAEAVAAAAHARPDVILLDLGMPAMDGYEACRRIRAEQWGRAMVIVALTGWGQGQDRRRTEEAGFNLHMVKPVDPSALLALLASPPAPLDPAA